MPVSGANVSGDNSREGTTIALSLSNGTRLFLATGYNPADTVTAVTNANPAVATTSAAHGIVNGAYFESLSGWGLANDRIFRASAASGSTLSYEGLDTTNTTNFPVGSGAGSIREITTWVQITQVLDFSISGGEPKYVTAKLLEEFSERQLPDGSSASSITFSIADDPTLPGYIALRNASQAQVKTALRLVAPNGSALLFNGTPFLNETPTIAPGAVNACRASFSLAGPPVRYAS